MKKVLITGAKGIIGTVVCGQLANFQITSVDLPQYDIRDYKTVEAIISGHDVVIHLAWNTKTDNATSGVIDPDNTQMFANVYRAALAAGVPRVIMASSVHVHKIISDVSQVPLSPHAPIAPNNPYGAHKLFMEALGGYYAQQGLEVVCIRFGGVTADNTPIKHEQERVLWLSHRDLGALIQLCVSQVMSKKFVTLWGMSRGAATLYDLSNPFGWMPQDTI